MDKRMDSKRQLIWEGCLEKRNMRLSLQWELQCVDKRLVPQSALKCWLSLRDDDDNEVVPCGNCIADGLSSAVSCSELQSGGKDPKVHLMQSELVMHCTGEISHDERRRLHLYAML